MDTLQNALMAVEAELADSEPKLAALTKRVAALRQTQAGLRNVLDLEAAPTPGPHTAASRPPTTGEAVATAAKGVLEQMIASTNLMRTSAIPSTTDGVRTILQENADTTMHLDEVRAEFKRRGWVDPDWVRPDATIYAAIMRLSDNDPHVVRESKKLWKYVTTPIASEVYAVGEMDQIEVPTS